MRKFVQFDGDGNVTGEVTTGGNAPLSNRQVEVALEFRAEGKRFNLDTGEFENLPPEEPVEEEEPDPV